jgi:hypothetical protein
MNQPNLTAEQAAAAIVSLINARPQSPSLAEIAYIIACVDPRIAPARLDETKAAIDELERPFHLNYTPRVRATIQTAMLRWAWRRRSSS